MRRRGSFWELGSCRFLLLGNSILMNGYSFREHRRRMEARRAGRKYPVLLLPPETKEFDALEDLLTPQGSCLGGLNDAGRLSYLWACMRFAERNFFAGARSWNAAVSRFEARGMAHKMREHAHAMEAFPPDVLDFIDECCLSESGSLSGWGRRKPTDAVWRQFLDYARQKCTPPA